MEFPRRLRRGVSALALLGLILPLAVRPAGAGDARGPAPVVETDLGKVRGATRDKGAVFKGIPFAAPPVGELRWRAAVPAAAWDGVRDATAFGPVCIQPVRPGEDGGAPQSEDCLSLNIATPDLSARRLPVLVSIHGGAYFVGSNRYLMERDVPALVDQGVVLVSPNYRLGRMGFFAHPALTTEAEAEGPAGSQGVVGNYWLSDQIAALQWVKRNIARFGGDPDNITILGCSAGGSAVNALLASPAARGLFQRASVHSGGGLFNATRPLDRAEQQGTAFAGRVGVQGADADALRRLRALTPAQVLAGDPGPPDFGAIVDGRLLPQSISAAFAGGDTATVPVISGSTSDEASVFGLMGFDAGVLADRFGIRMDDLRAAYGDLDDKEMLRQVQTDFIFTSAAMGMAALTANAGRPAYAYHFDYVAQAQRGQVAGVAHCGDMPYTFAPAHARGQDPLLGKDAEIAGLMQGYFLNFIRTGDPNGAGLPAWPRFTPETFTPLVIADETGGVPGFRARQLAPWYAKWSAETGQTFPR